jgi:hypothetical protein
MHETVNFIDPIFEMFIVYFVGVVGLSGSSGKTIGAMNYAFDVHQCEVEHKNGNDPAINAGRRLNVGV